MTRKEETGNLACLLLGFDNFKTCLQKRKPPAASFIATGGNFLGAGNGIRTRDLQLGKLTLYH